MKYKTEIETFRRRLRGDVPDYRIGHLVQEMEPFKDEMIPYLLDSLGEGYFTFGENAASVLAYIGDNQFVAPILERLEERATGQIKLRIDFIKNAALSASDKERQCIVESFITHLTRRRDIKSRNYESVILAILDALISLHALENVRLKLYLQQELEKGNYNNRIFQRALLTYAEMNLDAACAELQKIKGNIQANKAVFRASGFSVITQQPERIQNSNGKNFLIFTKDLTMVRPYAFRYENRRVYFFSQENEENKWFAGKANDFSAAFQVAVEYLEAFFNELNSLGNEKQITKKLIPFLALLEKHIDFKKWGFEVSYISPMDEPVIIFDSQWCRVRFQLKKEVDRFETYETLDISYGRLHAPNFGYILVWDGKDHWWWHNWPRARDFLHFLDGRSPEYLMEKNFSLCKGENNIKRLREVKREEQKSLVEIRAIEEAELWNYYAENFFRLFDLNNPEQWEKCRLFLKRYYELTEKDSFNQAIGIPENYEIC